jgi:hypothetical protein
MFKLKWHGDIPENVLELEHLVMQDLVKLHNDLEQEPSKLMFHHVFVDTTDGPLVFVWGVEGDNDHYHCKYDADPIWESYSEKDERERFTANVVENEQGELMLEFDPAAISALGWAVGDELVWAVLEDNTVTISKAKDGD